MTNLIAAELAHELASATLNPTELHNGSLQERKDLCKIDFSDPIAVQAVICLTHPFGDIVRYEGIVEACRRGQGEVLLQLLTPSAAPQFDAVAINEIMPTSAWIASFTDLQVRAEAICSTKFFATCAVSRALIEEVADEGPLGMMAQAYLYPPVKPKRRRAVSPSYITPRRARR